MREVVKNEVFVIPASAIGRISLWLKGGDPMVSIGSGFSTGVYPQLERGQECIFHHSHEKGKK